MTKSGQQWRLQAYVLIHMFSHKYVFLLLRVWFITKQLNYDEIHVNTMTIHEHIIFVVEEILFIVFVSTWLNDLKHKTQKNIVMFLIRKSIRHTKSWTQKSK